MGIFPIGGQRIGIVTDVIVGHTEFGEPITTEGVVWWDGCVLEMQTMSELQNDTVTTSEIAVVVGPVAGDRIPAVDDNGNPAPMLVADLKSDRRLRHDGRTYVMRADAVLQKDIRGRADHVECRCEHEEG